MADRGEIERAAARPMAFFPHDANAAQDMKVELLLEDCGMEGYGRWWRLCELLAATEGHRIEVGNRRIAQVIARNLMCDGVDGLMAFLKELSELGLIDMPGDGFVSSRRMMRNAEYFGRKRAAGSSGGRARRAGEARG